MAAVKAVRTSFIWPPPCLAVEMMSTAASAGPRVLLPRRRQWPLALEDQLVLRHGFVPVDRPAPPPATMTTTRMRTTGPGPKAAKTTTTAASTGPRALLPRQ
jgi:hypothetical protein